MIKKKKDSIKPVKIKEDIWFYPTPKYFGFVVWVGFGIERKCVLFKVTRNKLKKYLSKNHD